MIIDPFKIINDKALIMASGTKVQQSGIDLTIRRARFIASSDRDNIFYGEEIALPGHLMPGAWDIEFNEYVKVPKNAIAFIYARSTFNRRGAFLTTGVFDNGFSNFAGGVLHVTSPLMLEASERLAQIVFFQTEHEAKYEGQYNAQK